MSDGNLARRFVKENAGRIRCEPSGMSYKELSRECRLMNVFWRSKERF